MNIIEMARDSGLVLTCDMQDAYIRDGRYGKQLERFATLVRAAALEEAAGVCEALGVHPALNVYNGGPDWYKHGKDCAAAIRALKEAK